ncbi:InlB B-repeat-containing protein [Treponema ruminis]|uniref:Uncharacterized protein n=1 Tax=Treponema ruminis TaxID=744515 RepID=A0A7W8LKZ7_9SPIR|nr:InlB B-repeat-containing protein [Treponema ruminis]MBB5224810.1 hypothetical protein [Treponema ruminis]
MLLFSCSNFFSSSSSDNESAPNGKARVHFSLGKTDARTIMPEIYTEEDISLVELTAQKISEGEAIVYKLDGENEKLSWTSLDDLENVSIDIDYGTYTFVLNLSIEDGEENKTVLVQTCTLENQEINAGTKELVFNMQEDSGDVSIAVSWELRDETNRIGKIKTGLYTIASNGETTIGISDAEKTLTIKGADTSVTATGSYASVPSGSYLIKLFLYDNADATSPFNTITDIIKVNGYKTNYRLDLEFANLNLQYKVTFNPNGGLWEGGSEDSITTTRNMYSGFIPPKEVSKDGFVLVGWYYFEDGELSADLSQGMSSDDIMVGPEMGARDYTFYAIWGKQAGGNLSTDNRALIIKTDAGDTIYQNSKINLSVTDSAGEPVTDGVTYAAKILYKGEDINDLGGKTYYSVEGGVITLNGMTTPLPEANYQLYVTASRALSGAGNSVTSSQTFNVKLLDGIETQIALYNYNRNNSPPYLTYLVDSSEVGTASLAGDPSFYSDNNNIAFDAQGNFYTANFDSSGTNPTVTVYSDVLDAGLKLEIKDGTTDFTGGFKSFAIDLFTNTAYAWTVSSPSDKYTWYLFKYPKLISEGKADNPVFWASVQEDGGSFVPEQISVNNNILYVLGTLSSEYKLYVYDISSVTAPSNLSTFDVTTYITGTIGFSSSATVTDIYAMEGAVYLLVSDSSFSDNGWGSPVWSSTNKDIYKRGSVIEYVPSAVSGESDAIRYVRIKPKTVPTVAKTSITQMALWYYDGNNITGDCLLTHEHYEDGRSPTGSETAVLLDGLESKEYDGKLAQNTIFPDVYSVTDAENTDAEKFLSSPSKVVGIKPKKLVIADDGLAFYTEADGSLAYKNINRLVTIDLEEFVIESIQATNATFNSELSGYLRTATNLAPIASGGGTLVTNVSEGASCYYYAGSGMGWQAVDVATKADFIYLSVKPGE